MPIRIFITKYELFLKICTIFSCGRLAGLIIIIQGVRGVCANLGLNCPIIYKGIF